MTFLLEACTQPAVLEVRGPLRAPVDTGLRQKVDTLVKRGARRILLNLARLSEIDAAGVGELVRAYDTTRAVGGVLQVINANGHVRRLLDVAGLLRVLSDETRDADHS